MAFLMSVIRMPRANRDERIVNNLCEQVRKLADGMPEESRKEIIGVGRCVCCGKPVREGETICTNCLRDGI